MSPLPRPHDLTSLVLRTDFTDDTAWDRLKAAIDSADDVSGATYVSDPAYAGVSIQTLVDIDAAANERDRVCYLFLADATTMTDDEQRLLAVDLWGEPGRTFWLPPHAYAEVSANLATANMSFEEFADAADQSGTYRGLADG